MHKTTLMIVILISGCSNHPDVSPDVQPFPIEDHTPPVEKVTSETYPVYPDATPDSVTEETIEYAPGDLKWAHPDYRVIFHQKEEIKSYSELHPGYPDKALIMEPPYDMIRGVEDTHHIIKMMKWSRAFQNGVVFNPVYPTADFMTNLKQFKYHYFGVYLPKYLAQTNEEQLHLFECTANDTDNSYHVYLLGDLKVICGQYAQDSMVYVSKESETNKNIECYVSWYFQENQTGQDPYDKNCGDIYSNSIESVIWYGEQLPGKNANKNAFFYKINVGKISKAHQQRGCDAYGPDKDMCDKNQEDWSSYITYFE